MHPFSYTGLRLIHDQKVRDAMERTHVDAETAHHWLSRAYRRIVVFVGTLHTGKLKKLRFQPKTSMPLRVGSTKRR